MNSADRSLWIAVVLVAMLAGAMVPEARAVVVAGTTGNTTAPADDFGFANVGVTANGTGIYLGYRWVLTAQHIYDIQGLIQPAPIRLGGVDYAFQANTDYRLLNPTGLGLSTLTDLTVYRLAADPWLPSVKIAEDHLGPWDPVVMVGNGYNHSATLKAWEISGDYSGTDWVWTETTPPGGDARGYLRSSGRTIRWGTNVVEPGMFAVDLGQTDIVAFSTDFDEFGGTEFEAQAVNWDSGGGVFHKNGSQWELVGLMHAVDDFPNQPSQAIFGLKTYCSDLSEYRDQILAIIRPVGGDANLDGVVNEDDAAIVSANWGRRDGVIWEHGDFNEDGVVDALDAALMTANWGVTHTFTHGESESAMVPEPALMVLVAAGLLGLLACRVRA